MDERIIREANYVIATNKTIREVARDLNVSKTSIHRDLSYKLQKIDYDLYLKVKNIFIEHNNIRHIKGGEATKKKYMRMIV